MFGTPLRRNLMPEFRKAAGGRFGAANEALQSRP
jgi:hypothetical protein